MKKLFPNAPLLTYTNPQAGCVLGSYVQAPEVLFIGLCHELFGGAKAIQKIMNNN